MAILWARYKGRTITVVMTAREAEDRLYSSQNEQIIGFVHFGRDIKMHRNF